MKKIFLSLLLWFVWLLTFCNAEDYYTAWWDINIYSNWNYNFTPWFCANSTTVFWDLTFYYSDWSLLVNWSDIPTNNYVCFYVSWYVHNNRSSIRVLKWFNIYDFWFNCPECETCPEVDTWAILSGYVAIEDITTNYCVENDLCPVPSNFSQLFINDLEFPWKPLINVNIPDDIHWDYFSNDTGFDLYVGSGYDQNYIDSVLKINSYRPDSSDFTNIFVSGLTLLFPYLIFALFLVFMWKLIKRIFKH